MRSDVAEGVGEYKANIVFRRGRVATYIVPASGSAGAGFTVRCSFRPRLEIFALREGPGNWCHIGAAGGLRGFKKGKLARLTLIGVGAMQILFSYERRKALCF